MLVSRTLLCLVSPRRVCGRPVLHDGSGGNERTHEAPHLSGANLMGMPAAASPCATQSRFNVGCRRRRLQHMRQLQTASPKSTKMTSDAMKRARCRAATCSSKVTWIGSSGERPRSAPAQSNFSRLWAGVPPGPSNEWEATPSRSANWRMIGRTAARGHGVVRAKLRVVPFYIGCASHPIPGERIPSLPDEASSSARLPPPPA